MAQEAWSHASVELDWEHAEYVVCGSVRRECPVVNDVDVLVMTSRATLLDLSWPPGWHITERQGNRWFEDVWMELWWCPWHCEGPMRLFLTGPMELNVYMRTAARRRKMKLSQYGLFAGDGGRIDDNTEQSIFEALEMTFVLPECRDRWKEIANAG
jgi:DNA polymerase (family 10)